MISIFVLSVVFYGDLFCVLYFWWVKGEFLLICWFLVDILFCFVCCIVVIFCEFCKFGLDDFVECVGLFVMIFWIGCRLVWEDCRCDVVGVGVVKLILIFLFVIFIICILYCGCLLIFVFEFLLLVWKIVVVEVLCLVGICLVMVICLFILDNEGIIDNFLFVFGMLMLLFIVLFCGSNVS